MIKFPVTYVLYSHFSSNEKDDYDTYLHVKKKGEEMHNATQNFKGIQLLKTYLRGLEKLLTTAGHEGILTLFYAVGFEDLLDNLSKSKSELLRDYDKLDFAKLFAETFTAEIKKNDRLRRRVRMITSLDLHDILGRVNPNIAEKAHANVVGPEPGIRYDAPKIPEAILRLRLLGHGVPVLRIDQDVLFRDPLESDLGLFKAVSCAVLAYKLRLQDSSVATFIFSASYNAEALVEPNLAPDLFEAWGRSFATRIYPALQVDIEEIKRICLIHREDDRNKAWDEYARKYVNNELARLYYGLDASLTKTDGIKGLTEVGAHPFHSVISGALLCLSEGAILDLPPFSNFGYNVMWIDDHLKFSLHREMRHFTSAEELQLIPDLGASRLSSVFVAKGRPPVLNLPGYTLGVYLPALLWGTIVDAWITPNPILKLRYGSLNEDEKIEWQRARGPINQAPLPKAMREALKRGHLDVNEARQLNNELIDTAVKRIEKVRDCWIKLKTNAGRSFASYWASGEVSNHFPKEPFENFKNDWWKGLTKKPLKELKDLPSPMLIAVTQLAVDAVKYVEWTLEWPKYVQIVRAVEQGTFVGDMTWEPKP